MAESGWGERDLPRSEVLGMWRNTRMVVLTAISASLYAALLIPFKLIPLIPGVTELRPGNALPVVCSFLFGPAAAWGAAIGNVIGDFFGGFGPGALFGAIGNFLFGLLPFRLWRAWSDADPLPQTPLQWLGFVATLAVSAAACALVVAWGLQLLGFVPFAAMANIIFFNNFAVAVVLSPLLLRATYPRVRAAGLCFETLRPQIARPRRYRRSGALLVAVAAVAGIAAGDLVAFGVIELPFALGAVAGVSLAVFPFVLLLAVGAFLL